MILPIYWYLDFLFIPLWIWMPYWTDLWFLTLGYLEIPSAFRARLYGDILERLLSCLSFQLGSAVFFRCALAHKHTSFTFAHRIAKTEKRGTQYISVSLQTVLCSCTCLYLRHKTQEEKNGFHGDVQTCCRTNTCKIHSHLRSKLGEYFTSGN